MEEIVFYVVEKHLVKPVPNYSGEDKQHDDAAETKGVFRQILGMVPGRRGCHSIGLIVIAALVYIFVLRGNAQVTSLSLSEDKIVYGDYAEARVMVENSGLLTAKYKGTLTIDSTQEPLNEIQLKNKESQTLTVDLSTLKPGNHTISVGDYKKEIRILKPAEFEVTNLVIGTDSVLVGDTITVKATISNVGEVEGTYDAKFSYDGTAVEGQSIKVGPESEETIEAKIKIQKKGSHVVSLDDQKQTLTALNPAKIEITALKLSKAYAKPARACLSQHR